MGQWWRAGSKSALKGKRGAVFFMAERKEVEQDLREKIGRRLRGESLRGRRQSTIAFMQQGSPKKGVLTLGGQNRRLFWQRERLKVADGTRSNRALKRTSSGAKNRKNIL